MKHLLRRFRKNQAGNATIEFTLWLPLITGIIVGAFDWNIILVAQGTMWDVARDTARRVAIGQYDARSGQEYALSKLTFMGFEYGVDVELGSDVTVTECEVFIGRGSVFEDVVIVSRDTGNKSVTRPSKCSLARMIPAPKAAV